MTKEELQELRTMMKDVIGEELKPINDRLDSLEQGQKSIGNKITSLELKIENEVDRAVKTIGEGHSILNRKLDEKISLENRVETVENKVSAIEYTMKKAE